VKLGWIRWLAWGVWLATFVLYVTALVIRAVVGHAAASDQESGFASVSLLVAFVGFATVGALVVPRQPRNAVGWMFLAVGLLVALSVFGSEWASYVYVEGHGDLPGGTLAAWLYLWTWFPALGLTVLLPLLFPDGRPPGPRWRPVLWGMGAYIALMTALWWTRPGPMNDPDMGIWPDNPIGAGFSSSFYDTLENVGAVVLVACLALAGISSVLRLRRARGDERQQLKWTTYGIVVVVLWVGPGSLVLGSLGGDVALGLALTILPVTTALAMFRYRLYDVDRVISKTLVYGSLTAILGAAYAGLVLGGQAVFSSFAGGSNLAIAVSTLVVAALFTPVRRRVQAFVDRRFYRRRYDAQRTLDAFGARLREHVELDGLRVDLEGVGHDTVQPAHVSLWLRTGVGA
jgi:hypothetical protein